MKQKRKMVVRYEERNTWYDSGYESPNIDIKKFIIKIDFCCDKIEEAYDWNKPFVGFGDYENSSEGNPAINIYYCICGGPCDPPHYEDMIIRFCPFCGAKIEVIRDRIITKRRSGRKHKGKWTTEVEEDKPQIIGDD